VANPQYLPRPPLIPRQLGGLQLLPHAGKDAQKSPEGAQKYPSPLLRTFATWNTEPWSLIDQKLKSTPSRDLSFWSSGRLLAAKHDW
jgi:hypothetical protein